MESTHASQAAAVTQLAALAQESRLAIFRLLVQQGPEGLAVGRIAGALGLANATLSFHLKTLAQAGLIEARQSGRFIHYSANYAAMNGLVGFLTESCCSGVPCCKDAHMAAGRRKEKDVRD